MNRANDSHRKTQRRKKKNNNNKKKNIYIYICIQCALPVVTIMALWQLLNLGTGCTGWHRMYMGTGCITYI